METFLLIVYGVVAGIQYARVAAIPRPPRKYGKGTCLLLALLWPLGLIMIIFITICVLISERGR